VARLESFARSRGRTLLDLAFAWLLAQPTVASVIAGATRPGQIVQNVAAGAWQLSAEAMRRKRAGSHRRREFIDAASAISWSS
jgi:aryl-alcohol dehydrogenase-like predicted oxidoreductase